MSDQPQRARLYRLDPANWPPGIGVALFAGWLVYAVISTMWMHPLLWTVLPIGLTLYLFAERYPWRLILVFVAPVALLTAVSQVVATSSDASTTAAFAIYLLACGYFSLVVCVPDRDRWIARLPGWFLGARFAARLAWVRFEESLIAANALVRRVEADDDPDIRRTSIRRLVNEARRESRRPNAWNGAWLALAAWLDGLGELVGIEPTSDQARHVHDLLGELDTAHMQAIERTAVLDPS